MTKNVKLICKNCKTDFDYSQKEYNRQIKKGRTDTDFACSRSCSTSWRNKNIPYNVTESRKNHLLSICDNRRKGIFTWYLNKAKNRKHDFDLTEDYLQSLWDTQEGICPITNYKMPLYNSKEKNTPYTASLDRIDSNKGYVKGNVQFVCYSANLAKQAFTNNQILEFFKSV